MRPASSRARWCGVFASLLLILTAGPVSPAGEKTPSLHLTDDFATNSLKNYLVKGPVTWHKGLVKLGPGGQVIRKVALGSTLTVRAGIRLAAGEAVRVVNLKINGEDRSPGIILMSLDGGTLLSIPLAGRRIMLSQPARKGDVVEENWVVRLDVRYGLAHVKVWRAGAAEPHAGQAIFYLGHPSWLPEAVSVFGGRQGGGWLTALEITADAPAKPLSADRQRTVDRARELHQAASALYQKGEYRQASARATTAARLMKEACGSNQADTALALQNAAVFLLAADQDAAARTCLEEALAVKRKLFGADHPSTATTLNSLAAVLRRLGERTAARPYLEQALAARRKVLGDRHLDTANSLGHLASLLADLGNYAQARALLEKALAIQKQLLGDDHPITAQGLNALANLLHRMGEYPLARKHYEQALDIFTRKAGPRHPLTARALDNLGAFLAQVDQYAEAKRALEQALAIFQEKLGPEHSDTLACLAKLGHVLIDLGHYGRARQLQEQALDARRKKFGPAHPEVAASLQGLGDLCFRLEDFNQARSHYEQALAIVRKALGEDHKRTGECLDRLSQVLFKLEDYARARPCLEQHLEIQRRQRGAEHPDTAASLAHLGALFTRLGEFVRARSYYEQALAIHRTRLGADHPFTLADLAGLAGMREEMGDYPAARTLQEQVLAMRRKKFGPEHLQTATSLYDLGTLLLKMGDHQAARSHFEQALVIFRKVLGPEHPRTAMVLGQLGGLLHETGEWRAAHRYHVQAVEIHRTRLGPRHRITLTSLHNLAGLLADMGDLKAARKYLEQDVDAVSRTLGPDHPELATTLSSLASVLFRLHQDQAARQHLERSLAICRKKLGADHPKTAVTRHQLALLLHQLQKPEEARPHYEKALAIFQRKLGPDHPHTATAAGNLAFLLAETGQTGAAWDHYLKAAAVRARIAARLLAASAERDHRNILAQWRSGIDELLSLADQGRDLSAPRCQELFAAVLAWKGTSGRALAGRLEALVLGRDQRALRLYEEIKAVRYRLVQGLMHGSGRRPAREHRQELDRLRERRDSLERRLARRVEGFAALRKARRVTPEIVARHLVPGTVLIELVNYRHDDFAGRDRRGQSYGRRYAALLCWPRTGGQAGAEVRFVTLGPAGPLDQALHAWRAAVQRGRIDLKSERRLRQRLWEPLAKVLPAATRRLRIAPDGELALVPFEALRLADGKYLVERLHISYLSSAHDLLPRPLPADRSDRAVLLADPDYDAAGSSSRSGGRPAAAGQHRSSDWARGSRFERLPGFAREARAVATIFQGRSGWHFHSQQGAQASEETLTQVHRPRLLYCITHGFFLPDVRERSGEQDGRRGLKLVGVGSAPPALLSPGKDPRLRSGLALAGANRWKERAEHGISDGLLTALEVENLDLWGTELVVLSACETGLGEVRIGEGVLGLRRAFQLAGAQTVLASLWQVPDAETERLMRQFCRRWLAGTSRAEALRQAQLELLQTLRRDRDPARRQAPPLFWAGFICHGQP